MLFLFASFIAPNTLVVKFGRDLELNPSGGLSFRLKKVILNMLMYLTIYGVSDLQGQWSRLSPVTCRSINSRFWDYDLEAFADIALHPG